MWRSGFRRLVACPIEYEYKFRLGVDVCVCFSFIYIQNLTHNFYITGFEADYYIRQGGSGLNTPMKILKFEVQGMAKYGILGGIDE